MRVVESTILQGGLVASGSSTRVTALARRESDLLASRFQGKWIAQRNLRRSTVENVVHRRASVLIACVNVVPPADDQNLHRIRVEIFSSDTLDVLGCDTGYLVSVGLPVAFGAVAKKDLRLTLRTSLQ